MSINRPSTPLYQAVEAKYVSHNHRKRVWLHYSITQGVLRTHKALAQWLLQTRQGWCALAHSFATHFHTASKFSPSPMSSYKSSVRCLSKKGKQPCSSSQRRAQYCLAKITMLHLGDRRHPMYGRQCCLPLAACFLVSSAVTKVDWVTTTRKSHNAGGNPVDT